MVDPLAPEKRPGTQLEHVLASVENVPGSQDEHHPDPALENVPKLQLEQLVAEVAPRVARNFPTGHAWQLVDAFAGW